MKESIEWFDSTKVAMPDLVPILLFTPGRGSEISVGYLYGDGKIYLENAGDVYRDPAVLTGVTHWAYLPDGPNPEESDDLC